MKDYRVSDLESAAYVGAVWLIALSVALALSPSDAGGYGLIDKAVTAAVLIAGALYLFKVGRMIGPVAESAAAAVKENARRLNETTRRLNNARRAA
jgi:hypothetical protein